ncbi:lipase/acyltransferase domain-containing protein [Klebsiella pneumoniae]
MHQVVGTAHKENTGKKVFLLGHSMGGIAVHTVLRNHVSRNC